MGDSNQSNPPRRRIPSLDGLRAVSIAMVVLGHASETIGNPFVGFLAHYAQLGVRVFFVISGYLITTLLVQERTRTGSVSLRAFYRRRCYRILPAACAYLLIVTVFFWHIISGNVLVCAWLYCIDFVPHGTWLTGHLWSLAVEEQFYLLWPLLLILFWNQRKGIAMAAFCAAPFFRAWYFAEGWKAAASFAFPCVQDALAAGCLLALCGHKLGHRRIDQWILPILIFVAFAERLRYPKGIEPTIIISLVNVGIALLVDHCIRKEYPLLNWTAVMWVGWISYSLYLWQQLFIDPYWRAFWTAFPLNLVSALACAVCSYYFIEQPFLRLKGKTRPFSNSPLPS